jgi:large subunit ribosomal protein L21
MKYAVIKTGGKQYKVSEGDVIDVDRLVSKDGKFDFTQVLLIVEDGKVKVGKPVVNGAKVETKVLGDFKGEKIRVSKFKSKVRYRRVSGFRAALTKVQIEKITEGSVKKVEEKPSIVKKTAVKKS